MLDSTHRLISAVVLLLMAALFSGCRTRNVISPSQPQTGSATPNLNGRDEMVTLTFEGSARRYHLHLPPPSSQKLIPVVMVLHGGGGNIEGQAATDHFENKADRYGMAIVRPLGFTTSVSSNRFATWNAGSCCGAAVKQNSNDVGFLNAVIEDLISKHDIDPEKIYLTGLSNGAMMAVRMACELSDKIAAIGMVGGNRAVDRCLPKRPVPLIAFHGTLDPCAPFAGGPAGECFKKLFGSIGNSGESVSSISYPSVSTFWSDWGVDNGVSAAKTQSYEKGKVRCTQTPGEHPFIKTCVVEDGGHTWPGGSYGGPCTGGQPLLCRRFQKIMGELNTTIDASEEQLRFFSGHSRR